MNGKNQLTFRFMRDIITVTDSVVGRLGSSPLNLRNGHCLLSVWRVKGGETLEKRFTEKFSLHNNRFVIDVFL